MTRLWFRDPLRFGFIAALNVLLLISEASAAERSLVLEVIMNGRSTGRVGEFTDRDGLLYARPSELHDLGFALPAGMTEGTAPIPLSALPNVHATLNESKQTLVVVASDAAQEPTQLGGGRSAPLAPLSPSGYGALLNYDAVGTFTNQANTAGALLDLRAFSPYGLFESTGLSNITPTNGEKSFVRLDTTYTYSEPGELRRWQAGDVVSGALSWTRAVRLGGGQLSSDFGLRPDLVTYPLPVISASAAVPSTVNVVVDGIRQFSEAVQPGPFAIRTLPVVTGAGQVAVAVQDALGRQTLVTLPFYASTALLKPGLASYSIETGLVRQNYGLAADRYSSWAMSASASYGLTPVLTLQGHAEGTNNLALLGGGVALQIGTVGIATVALSGSTGRGGLSTGVGGGAAGSLISAGFQRVSSKLSFSVAATFATSGYRDIATVGGSPVPRSTLNTSLGYQFGTWGNVGVAYLKQIASPDTASGQAQLATNILADPQAEVVTASYSVPVAGLVSLYATCYDDLHTSKSYGAEIGVSFSLGQSTSASVGTSLDKGRAAYTTSVAKPALEQNDYGYRLADTEGVAAQRSAEGEFLSRFGYVSAGVDQSSSQTAGRATARGALAFAGGDVFTSDQINDSFAVVSTGDVAGVPVLYENRLVGTTDSSGKLLVPSLLSYQNNRLSVDSTRLPADIDVGQTSFVVRPPDRSGIAVKFAIKKVHAALLTLQDGQGKPIPLGSIAKVQGEQDQPVGYDGAAYVTGLKPTNRMIVVLPTGKTCIVHFAYKPVSGDIPAIGPFLCQ